MDTEELEGQREEELNDKRNKSVLKKLNKKEKNKQTKQIIKKIWEKIPTNVKLIIFGVLVGIILICLIIGVTIDSDESENANSDPYEEELVSTTSKERLTDYLTLLGQTDETKIDSAQRIVDRQIGELELSEQQRFALISIAYNKENIDGFVDTFNNAASRYTKNEWNFNKAIWDNWWKKLSIEKEEVIKTEATFNTYLTGNYNPKLTGVKTYYYYTEEELQKFNINTTGLLILQNTIEENEVFKYTEVSREPGKYRNYQYCI